MTMKKDEPTSIHNLRTRHNIELIRRMRDGDPLKSFDSRASWFPPRPVIEKDSRAVSKLYGAQKRKTKVAKVQEDHDGSQAIVISFDRPVDRSTQEMDDGHSEAS
jgi:hypothetical protein